MRVFFCWSHISGYMAACWRALAGRPDVEVTILAYGSRDSGAAFDDSIVAGLNVRLLDERERGDATLVRSIVADAKPDVLVLSGWSSPAYRALAFDPALAHVRRVMTMDTPYRGTIRQRLGRFKMASYFARIDRVMVPGERAWQLARVLGFPEAKIRRGLYGIDYDAFAPLHEQRVAQPGSWPRRFLFTGRYHPEKGVDVLLNAYAHYRTQVSDPWPLTCCGAGELKHLLAGREGVEDLGFVQPAEMHNVMLRCGVFLLASRYEPWGVVIAEGAAAGLPVICTESCGAGVEVVRPMFNGMTVATGDAPALARAMRWAHDHYMDLPEIGARGCALGVAFGSNVWADRWKWMFDELLDERENPRP